MPPPVSATFTPGPPPQANPPVPAPQSYGGNLNQTLEISRWYYHSFTHYILCYCSVVQGIPGAGPYMIPGQAQLYPQGPPPTYDQALTHPAIMGQPVRFLLLNHFSTVYFHYFH